jgi:monovalent cation:H+ antiporter-2, CPA2 family
VNPLLLLGVVVLTLAVLARGAGRFGLSAIPLYLLAGLAFGVGGLLPLGLEEGFIATGAELGVVLLLFMIGLEYTAEELRDGLRAGARPGLVNLVLNFTPGVAAGLLLGWGWIPALLLGGVTFNTSTGIMAKLLAELGRIGNRETPAVLSVSVLEDLTMALYLPLITVALVGTGVWAGLVSTGVAVVTVGVVLFLATRYGGALSRILVHPSEEVVLLSVLGVVLMVAGVAGSLQVSTAVGAFLTGLALSGEVAERTRVLLGPLRDLFAAVFFLFFGLQVDAGALGPVLAPALLLAAVTALTKMVTGWVAAASHGVATRGRIRAGLALIPRGEFSIVIAGLGVAAGVEATLGPLAAAYVLILAIAGPFLARTDRILARGVERVAGRNAGAVRDLPVRS